MPHLVVLGTSHPLQCGHASVSAAAIASYEREISNLIQQHGVKRIAEEMSSDGLARHQVSVTIAERIAKSLPIDHQHIDLTSAERGQVGLGDAPVLTINALYQPTDSGQSFRNAMTVLDHEVRERLWVFRLLSKESSPVLFICGSDHVAPIARIWQILGLTCHIAHRDYAA
jgi:hypothetical protein